MTNIKNNALYIILIIWCFCVELIGYFWGNNNLSIYNFLSIFSLFAILYLSLKIRVILIQKASLLAKIIFVTASYYLFMYYSSYTYPKAIYTNFITDIIGLMSFTSLFLIIGELGKPFTLLFKDKKSRKKFIKNYSIPILLILSCLLLFYAQLQTYTFMRNAATTQVEILRSIRQQLIKTK